MKILVLVQAVELARYPELVKTQKETWNSISNEEVDVYYYYPTIKEDPGIKEDKIIVGGSEHWSYMFINTIRAFREVMPLEWDYIFKTDLSAYVDKSKLVEALQHKPRTNYYGGHMYPELAKNLNTNFLWGEGFAISKDIAALLIDNYANMPTGRMGVEDVWIGNLLTDKIKWDESLTICEYYKKAKEFTLNHIYRCKNDSPDTVYFDDIIKAMREIHEKVVK